MNRKKVEDNESGKEKANNPKKSGKDHFNKKRTWGIVKGRFGK